MATKQPRFYAESDEEKRTGVQEDPAEHFSGYAVMGQPFRSGYYLAFRHFRRSSVGPGYRAVWVRTPSGGWTIYADAAPELSCARYFGSALDEAVTTTVGIEWDGPASATIRVPDRVEWHLELGSSLETRALTSMALRMPPALWRRNSVLRAMGAMAGTMLGAGRMSICGVAPNGQSFQAQPRRLWQVLESTAVVGGRDAGGPGPLREQDRLGGFWLPQRGLFAADLGVRFPSTVPAAVDAVAY
ncbi:MAG: hypothetical protein M3017_14510 [Actinomycetota bacterium]|nr:hypothetical protein [Actinomycetota bacterium]